MIAEPDVELAYPRSTAGEIAVNNLASARQGAWGRFWYTPRQPGVAEYVVESEQMTLQFVGDLEALDRLDRLVEQLDRLGVAGADAELVRAKVASTGHRFAEARGHLAQASALGAKAADVDRLALSIDQACGTQLERVHATRERTAASGRLEDLVPFGALLADLREFDEADRVYRRALREYQEVSPFAVAWVCFQLGVLWGELVTDAHTERAARWYRKALEYLPCYVKARVHLAEIEADEGRTNEAEALLMPAVSSGDPEVDWRLADVMVATGRPADAAARMQTARSGFETLLEKHLLAFADHGAEFYAGSGNDGARALELARINIANRPTLRALEQGYDIAVSAGNHAAALDMLAVAAQRWASTAAFRSSPLAAQLRGGSPQ